MRGSTRRERAHLKWPEGEKDLFRYCTSLSFSTVSLYFRLRRISTDTLIQESRVWFQSINLLQCSFRKFTAEDTFNHTYLVSLAVFYCIWILRYFFVYWSPPVPYQHSTECKFVPSLNHDNGCPFMISAKDQIIASWAKVEKGNGKKKKRKKNPVQHHTSGDVKWSNEFFWSGIGPFYNH